jgi:hypothetical protein
MSESIHRITEQHLKEAIVNTWSNTQLKQNGLSALVLSLLGQRNGTKLTRNSMTNPAGKQKQASKANSAVALWFPVAQPAHPIYRGESAHGDRSFSLRHSDWTHCIRGFIPLSQRITP